MIKTMVVSLYLGCLLWLTNHYFVLGKYRRAIKFFPQI